MVSFKRKATLGFSVSILLMIVMAIIANNTINQLNSSAGWVTHTHYVIRKALSISQKLAMGFEMKISSGGFDGIIKNDNYDKLVASTLVEIQALKQTVSDDPKQVRNVQQLQELTSQYFAGQRSRALTDPEESRSFYEIDSLAHKQCDKKIKEIIAVEHQKLIVREAKNTQDERKTRIIIIAIVFLGIVCLAQLFRYILKAFEENARAQHLLKISESVFANSFEHAGIGMALVSAEGKWMNVNPALCHILGYSKEEFEGHSFQEITHPDDLNLDLDKFQRTIAGEIDNYSIEKRYRHKNGHYIDASLCVSAVRDEDSTFFVSQIQDITNIKKLIGDLKQKNAEIEVSQGQLKLFIENLPAAICMLDNDLNFIVSSKKWGAEYGIDEKSIFGKNLYEIFPHLVEKWRTFHRRALAGEVVSGAEEEYVSRQGKTKWTAFEFRPWYQNSGDIGGIILFTENVTAQKQAKEELIKAKEEAEQAMVAKANFLSTMSHEIRTPMNAVIGFTNLLLQNAREDQKEYLEMLRFSGENLLVLINDILDYSKIDSGNIKLESIDFSLHELVQNITRGFQVQADDKGITLELLADPQIPEQVQGDPVRLTQILTNLVSNALKFTEKGKVSLSVTLVEKTETETTFAFVVKDTGIGIPKDKHNFIFDFFTQASSDTTRKFGGTGLGLAITRGLLKLHNSDIVLDSVPGEGSTFRFLLSFKNSEKKKALEAAAVTEKKSLKGMQVLIVEDNRINVVLAKQFLKRWEIDCDVAENGVIGLEMVRNKNYDLVLMDLQMPEMDGYTASREIRKLDGDLYRQLPIIALTASAMSEIKENVLQAGMNDMVTKPFNPDELYTKISRYKPSAN